LAKRLHIDRTLFDNLLKQISGARRDCVVNANIAETTFTEPWQLQNSFLAGILRRDFFKNKSLPKFVKKTKKFDVTKAAFNLLGTVFGSESSSAQHDNSLRSSSCLIVFFVGGCSASEVKEFEEISVARKTEIYVGTTQHFSTSSDAINTLYSYISKQKKQNVAEYSKLFS